MTDARSGSGNTMGSLGIITIGGAVGLVSVFFVVQCYRGWQRWSKARQSGGQSLGHTVVGRYVHVLADVRSDLKPNSITLSC